ncbi:MAG TPA: OBAP family protein [Thermodesulfobacteriota bacterium]
MRTRVAWLALPAAAYAMLGAWRRRSRDNSPSHVHAPGSPTPPRMRLLEAGARALQSRAPIAAINAYLDGFHFRSGEMGHQREAHHYCAMLNDDLMQCVIYDGNTRDAKLIGIEYIVSERLFRTLPDDEKPLWHSHHYEMTSGMAVFPGLPPAAERAMLQHMASTYGKTWQTWDTEAGDALPLGIPHLMMGFTADGQLDPKRLADRNRRLGILTEGRRRMLADIPVPEVAPGANAWEAGEVIQIAAVRQPAGGRTRRAPEGAP